MNTAKIIDQALAEDRYTDDITSRLFIPQKSTSSARIILKEDAVMCGLDIAKAVFKRVSPQIKFQTLYKDGDRVAKGTTVAKIKGSTRSILAAERVALNFLGHLSGIATNSARYVKAIKPYKAKVFDTRKTTPGLRELEKYAVRCGGAKNHRMNLSDMILVKDNHRAIYKNHHSKNFSLPEAILHAKKHRHLPIEVEVDTIKEFKDVLKAAPDFILLDNMSIKQMKAAVKLAQQKRKRPLLEASGGVNLKNIKSIAQTGVDRISVGALTHTHQSINFSLDIK